MILQGLSAKLTDHNPRSHQNTGAALIFPFLWAEGEGDVNTQLECRVMHPAFSFAYYDGDSCLPEEQPKKWSTGCFLEGKSQALKGEGWIQHASILSYLPQSSVLLNYCRRGTSESMHLRLFLYLT